MTVVQLHQPDGNASDEELMLQLASGRQDALGPLYSRYAALFFNLAAQSLDRAAAKELVQEVFLAVWRHADTFNPDLGNVRSWARQIAHYRIANELRRQRRRPLTEPEPEIRDFVDIPDGHSDPAEEAWHEQQATVLREAVGELPPLQREAVGLAFFDELSHQEV